MPKQSREQSKHVIVLPPPIFSENPLSSKYELILTLKWGEFEKYVKVSRETYTFQQDLIKNLNEALVEGAESNPYLIS